MRKVIDSNQLRSPNLRAFLAQSKSNFAILTDYCSMEAYKGNSLEGVWQSMSILSEFPDQVIILKTTGVVCSLNGRGSGLQKRLIDQEQTREFGVFIRDLNAARAGDRSIEQQILDHGSAASYQLKRILKDAPTLAEGFAMTARLHSKKERAIVRGNLGYTPELMDKTVKSVREIAAQMFNQHPNVVKAPNYRELPNTFVFRYSLCVYLLALDWGAQGGVQDAKPERLQNDLIDMNFAAYATFFDGLLSNDAKCVRIHKQARYWLRSVFQCRLSGD